MNKKIVIYLMPPLLLVGCGSTNPNKDYINQLHNEMPGAYTVDNNDLISTGHDICMAIENGEPLVTVLENGLSTGLTPTQVGILAGTAIKYFCPKQLNQVSNLAATNP